MFFATSWFLFASCRAESPGHTRSPRRPVIFLGLDAADWSLLDGYMARGVMPNLARLSAEGAGGRLKTISPPLRRSSGRR